MDKSYILTSRDTQPSNTKVEVRGCIFGDRHIPLIAGPCAVEDEQGYLTTAQALKQLGASMLRGGTFKPRTSPYTFQGTGALGMNILRQARELTGLPVVTEILDVRHVEEAVQAVDMLQIGSRNMHNTELLKEVARTGHPVLLKRGFAATIEEWLLAAEYILAGGNSRVVLCERGIRTFETATRNTLDLSAVPLLKHLSHLPVIVDPSHATGQWRLVPPMSLAAIAAGADGLLIEVHQNPGTALCDGAQSLTIERFGQLVLDLRNVADVLNRSVGEKC